MNKVIKIISITQALKLCLILCSRSNSLCETHYLVHAAVEEIGIFLLKHNFSGKQIFISNHFIMIWIWAKEHRLSNKAITSLFNSSIIVLIQCKNMPFFHFSTQVAAILPHGRQGAIKLAVSMTADDLGPACTMTADDLGPACTMTADDLGPVCTVTADDLGLALLMLKGF